MTHRNLEINTTSLDVKVFDYEIYHIVRRENVLLNHKLEFSHLKIYVSKYFVIEWNAFSLELSGLYAWFGNIVLDLDELE